MVPILLLALLNIHSAFGAPASPEFYYQTEDGNTLNRPTVSRPVTFKGVAIGTTELNKTAESGAIHHLEDGHHFFHKGWYLSDSAAGTPIWQYLPDYRNPSPDSQPKKRQSGYDIDIDLGNGVQFLDLDLSSWNMVWRSVPLVEEISWSTDWTGSFALDLFDNGSFVASSTSLVGDLVDIFFNALEIFA